MTLQVTNSLTGETEPFEPQDPDSVLLYYCGLTVSDLPHLGHARSWVHVDVMHRWLEQLGYDVRHVENFTDVNEKIVARTGEEFGDTEPEVARHFVGETIEDMRSLNLKRADVYPRVSEHVPEIIDLVETLLERGYAYEANGSVYFDVSTFEEYGKLSNQDLDEIESQGDPDERSEKHNAADFALWKAGEAHPDDAAPGGQTWDSPWGEGRPGWHIECSAMSTTHLDDSIDIHVGGQDLIFPHHENEIAQSEAATGERFASYWLHVNLLETEGEKMSSSLENFFTVRNAVREFGPNAIRMFLLSAAFDSKQTYSEAALDEAVERWERLDRGYRTAVEAADSPDAGTKVVDEQLRATVEDARKEFEAAMNDNFNTREAIAALLEIASAVNKHTEGKRYDYQGLTDAIDAFETLGGEALGFAFDGDTGGDVRLAEELVELVLDVREDERAAGNYERADALRDDLEGLGITVEDSDDGVEYRF
ncbi:cysteine--tRNA ligase [Natranaeroarchaeum aerophilus]|uniref:Cysteine--tRNA ligase n=1 Tax=Natranaeroarchaeum aerophilus TaxID=2917711 RepID=A0AAE3FPB4_9EURY|nr:cysteine--tRNA ligase [Natranaeroarchaeum aerophilus]MCL9813137.1 cysteine--tRNA ligase [Natranaeroarchaeum aerophilus]